MANNIPPPNPDALLPPLLTCLPSAFASPRPPPALLPLLSPILRQRVQLLSSIPTTVPSETVTSNTSTTSSWLPLLSRSVDSADSLPTHVSSPAFEPHPVSCEIEFRDIDSIRYRRLDEETLQARLDIKDLGLAIVYLWCIGDLEGGGNGWRVAEVNVLSEADEEGEGKGWTTGIIEAGETARKRVLKAVDESGSRKDSAGKGEGEGQEEDDAYWAQYDNTPARTPGPRKLSVAPSLPSATALESAKGTSEEEQYFAQYADVQPALDSGDPSEGVPPSKSSLQGDEITTAMGAHQPSNPMPMSHPRPSSSSSAGGNAVPRLEETAQAQGVLEMSIRQHINTSIKSLFRLARASGIERVEFERLINREVEALEMLD